jgi:hypothetical protein
MTQGTHADRINALEEGLCEAISWLQSNPHIGPDGIGLMTRLQQLLNGDGDAVGADEDAQEPVSEQQAMISQSQPCCPQRREMVVTQTGMDLTLAQLDDALSAAIEAQVQGQPFERLCDGIQAARMGLYRTRTQLLALRDDIEGWTDNGGTCEVAARTRVWRDWVDHTLSIWPTTTRRYLCFAGGDTTGVTASNWQLARAWLIEKIGSSPDSEAQGSTTNHAILSSLENPSEWFDGRWDWQSRQDGRFTVIEIVDAADQSCAT